MRSSQFIVSKSGTSLIEIVIGTMFLAAIVTSVAVIFPKVSKIGFQNRRAWVANNMALSKLQELKKAPYFLVLDTPAPGTLLPNGNIAGPWALTIPIPGSCDCSKANLALLPDPYAANSGSSYDETFNYNGVIYRRKTCVNQAALNGAGVWTPQCQNAGETGNKHIRVNISWSDKSGTRSTDLEDLVSQT